jgi:hypothetical protein
LERARSLGAGSKSWSGLKSRSLGWRVPYARPGPPSCCDVSTSTSGDDTSLPPPPAGPPGVMRVAPPSSSDASGAGRRPGVAAPAPPPLPAPLGAAPGPGLAAAASDGRGQPQRRNPFARRKPWIGNCLPAPRSGQGPDRCLTHGKIARNEVANGKHCVMMGRSANPSVTQPGFQTAG